MIGLLDKKDTADYWMFQLVNAALYNMDTDEYSVSDKFFIINDDDQRPSDSNVITISSQTTYDKTFYGSSSNSEYIMEYKIYQISVETLVDMENKQSKNIDISAELCMQVGTTLNNIMGQNSFPGYHFVNVIRTSVPKRGDSGKNKQTVYDLRFSCMFRKKKEIFIKENNE